MTKKTFLMRGKERQEFLEYFERLGGIPSNEAEESVLFEGSGWRAKVGPQTVYMLRTIAFPEVEIMIEAEDKVFEDLLKDYRLKFLTAGG